MIDTTFCYDNASGHLIYNKDKNLTTHRCKILRSGDGYAIVGCEGYGFYGMWANAAGHIVGTPYYIINDPYKFDMEEGG